LISAIDHQKYRFLLKHRWTYYL